MEKYRESRLKGPLLPVTDGGINKVEDHVLRDKITNEAIESRLGALSLRERRVIILSLGLEDGMVRSIRRISQETDIPRSTVWAIKKRAEMKMKAEPLKRLQHVLKYSAIE